MSGCKTPKVIPNDAMMNENSPICVSAKPLSMAMLNGCPVASIPKVPKRIMPTTTTMLSRAMVPACATITAGSTIIPTEMKNTAPKRSLTGVMMRSMRSASTVPANIEPITKAPSASEKPDLTENTAMRKQRPMAIISIISSVRKLRKRLKSEGSRNTPTVNHITKKNDNLSTLRSISPLSTVLLMATLESTTIMTTAKRSSTMSTAKIIGTKRRCRIFRSVSAFNMMVVDDMEIMPPRKMLSTAAKPSSLPTRKPRPIIPTTIIRAVITAGAPTASNFLKLNSNPNENSRITMPICAQNSILTSVVTEGKSEKCGLAMKPATM